MQYQVETTLRDVQKLPALLAAFKWLPASVAFLGELSKFPTALYLLPSEADISLFVFLVKQLRTCLSFRYGFGFV